MKMLLLILGLLIGAPWRCNAWTIQHFDCASPQAYLSSNGSTIATAIGSFLPVVSTQPQYMPTGDVIADLSYTGVKANFLKLYVQLGGSPAAVINVGLHLVCLSLVP